ncbi:MAG: 50S ribosomal protein L24 [Clostridia bacterium]|nr:50S ribosomal protein L24 [Clostridia bacterium]
MSLNVKKGDTVLVIAGKDKGKTGKVLVAQPTDNSVVVAGVNIISKHKKPRSANDKGGIIKKEGKIHVSNVQVVCPVCNKATRINNEIVDGKKVRQCKKCGANLDTAVKKETKKTATKTTTKATTTKTTTAEKKPVAKKEETKKVETKSTASTAKKSTTKTTAEKPATKTTKATAEKTTKSATATKSTAKKSTTTKKVESK